MFVLGLIIGLAGGVGVGYLLHPQIRRLLVRRGWASDT
jgi:hypothetical protein